MWALQGFQWTSSVRGHPQGELFDSKVSHSYAKGNRWKTFWCKTSLVSTYGNRWLRSSTTCWGLCLLVFYISIANLQPPDICVLGVGARRVGVLGKEITLRPFLWESTRMGEGGSLCISKSQLIFPVREQWDIDPRRRCWMLVQHLLRITFITHQRCGLPPKISSKSSFNKHRTQREV